MRKGLCCETHKPRRLALQCYVWEELSVLNESCLPEKDSSGERSPKSSEPAEERNRPIATQSEADVKKYEQGNQTSNAIKRQKRYNHRRSLQLLLQDFYTITGRTINSKSPFLLKNRTNPIDLKK